MAETVNTSALLLSDGQGGYSKAFMESMTDIVKLQNGSSLTEKLAEIDGKLPITLTSGTLPETLNSGRLLVNDNNFYCGSESNLPCQLARLDQMPTQYIHPTEKQCNYVYTHPSTIQCNAASEINNLKSSVSSGKTQVANAITGKGVSASGNDTFATLASKISQIQSAKQVVFSTTADSSGKWYMPAFGFVPRAFYAFQMRAWNEKDYVAFQSIDFALGMDWTLERVYLYPEDEGRNSNGAGIGGRFTPSKYTSVPNSSTDRKSRLNPNNYVNGQLFPFYAPYMYNYENSQYVIYVIPA